MGITRIGRALLAAALVSSLGCAELGLRGVPREPAPSSAADGRDEPGAGTPQPVRPLSVQRAVIINGKRLSSEELAWLDRLHQATIPDGKYWYDARAGLWGYEGGPPAGSAMPNLDIGDPLRADASHGYSGVFVNGRDLHPLEIVALTNITVVLPGRYWLDAAGNGGFEGGPALWNIHQLARAKAAAQGSSGGDPWMINRSGVRAGGDGKGYVFVQAEGYSISSE
jgi:hypothetical protein